MIPDKTLENAPPRGIKDTAQENSISDMTKSLLTLRISGPDGEDHPREIP